MKVLAVKSKKELKSFIKFPFELYKNDPNWVAPLIIDQMNLFNEKKNPYYEHSEVQPFLAFQNNKVVGRITAHTNTRHNNFHKDKVGFFGFFETIDVPEVTQALVETASEWLKKRDKNVLRGPMNFSTNDECGLLIDGFRTPPYIMMPYNKKYYKELLEKNGLKKSMDLFAYNIPVSPPPERIKRLAEHAMKRNNFTIRTLANNKKERRRDIETVFHIYSKAWEPNWGFVPLSKKEFDHIVDTLLPIALPEMVLIAEVNGEPAGFCLTLPDYNFVLKKMRGRILPFGLLKALYYKNKIPGLRLITMGVIKEFQNRGIDIVFYYRSFQTAYQLQYKDSELSWILENNAMMNHIVKSLGGTRYKTFRIFDKKIQ
ncbi:MAG: GNAT family N-acetyltransferase [Candidatus Cloacimonadota bacterium]|nr:GNAT family N-acetyltransferase [Candidatus Cloacimonadota bacterium]